MLPMNELVWALIAAGLALICAVLMAYVSKLRARLATRDQAASVHAEAAPGKSNSGQPSPGATRAARSEQRDTLLRKLLDESPLAVVLYSDLGTIEFANGPANQLFFDGENAEGRNFLQLATDGPEAFRKALLSASDQVVSFDLEGQRETYQFERRVFPHAGEPHTLLVVRHVTRQVARQEIDVLKRVVRVLSHEVNNALAPVSSLVHSARQIMKTGLHEELLESIFSTIDERAAHLSQFIAGYAGLARLPPPHPHELELEPVLMRLRTLYPETTVVARGPGTRVFFDSAQVEQALINLIKNAREAGGAITDVVLEVTASAELTELRVLDRGQGFSPEALENAVLPFFTTKPSGSGVGLALVREVTEAHGGELVLEAREGGGASVTMRLPDPRVRRPASAETMRKLTLTRR
jgi:two-component system nitrogen regulation sensor histidine kinase NtrY